MSAPQCQINKNDEHGVAHSLCAAVGVVPTDEQQLNKAHSRKHPVVGTGLDMLWRCVILLSQALGTSTNIIAFVIF